MHADDLTRTLLKDRRSVHFDDCLISIFVFLAVAHLDCAEKISSSCEYKLSRAKEIW